MGLHVATSKRRDEECEHRNQETERKDHEETPEDSNLSLRLRET